MVVCAQCGTQLALGEDDAALILGRVERVESSAPLAVGMRGTIKDARYDVIGRLGYRQEGIYVWDEFLLYSPEAGYAWLVWENHHFTWVRSTNHKPDVNVRSLSYRDIVVVEGVGFTVFERYSAEVVSVEGELTWVAKVGDRVQAVDAVAPPQLYCAEWSEKEIEYFWGEYMAQDEIVRGFGLTDALPPPVGVAPCQPFVSPLAELAGSASFFGAVFLALLAWAFLYGQGTPLVEHRFTGADVIAGTQTPPFVITEPNTLCRLDLSAGLDNAWAWYDVELVKDRQGPVYGVGEQLSYYRGFEDGESWSEGSPNASQLFKIVEPGTYWLKISGTGGRGDSALEGFADYYGSVRLRGNVVMKSYFFAGAVLSFGLVFLYRWRRSVFEHERWASEEEDDEDE